MQVVGTKACLAAVMFIGPKVPTAYVLEVWQEAQSVPDRYGMCDGVSTAALGVKLLYQVSAAVPQSAVAGDAGVEHGIRRQTDEAVGRVDVAGVASRIGGVRHVARRHRGAVPVRRGVANGAVVRRHHLPQRMVGRAALQAGAGCAHIERETGLMA